MKPIFSIIVPVYNVSEYVERCLQSIANQTLKDIEVIIVDDGSTDSSLEICKNFSKNFSNFFVYSKNNEGQGVARNYALERARGVYICYVDSDDWIEPNLCFDMHEIFALTDADFLNFGLDFFTPSEKIVKRFNRFGVTELHGAEIFKHALLDDQVLSVPWNKIYKLQFLNEHAIRFPPARSNEDIYYSRAVSRFANKAIFVSKVYYHALVRPSSTSRKMSVANFLSTENLIQLERDDFLNSSNNKEFSATFDAHVIKLFSVLLIQAAFRVKDYKEYVACHKVAESCGFSLHSNRAEVTQKLKVKNKLMLKICHYPFILRICALILNRIGLRPY